MNEPAELEAQLGELRDYLKGIDVAPRVMAEVQLIELAPGEASLRRRLLPRLAAGVAFAAMLLVALTIWLAPMDSARSVAFAEVQAAVQQVETAVVMYEFTEMSWFNHTIFYRRDRDVVRTEWPSGIVDLRDVKQGKLMVLNPRLKTARSETAARQLNFLNTSNKVESPQELLDKLADIQTAAVTQLGEREFGGRKLVGFELPEKAILDGRMRGQIWVDPQSRLPVRYEVLPAEPANLARRYSRYVATFTFNRPLDAGLFALQMPEGYTTATDAADPRYLDQFPPPPQDETLAAPIIEPNIGIGPAHFGMTVEEVVAALGKPTGVNEYFEPSPQRQAEVAAASKKAAAEADEKGLTGRERLIYIARATRSVPKTVPLGPPSGMELIYHSQGFRLMVSHDQGLLRIFCLGPGAGMKPFKGKTSQGISIGATLDQIESAYGAADTKRDRNDGNAALYYRNLHLLFNFRDRKLWEISLDKP